MRWLEVDSRGHFKTQRDALCFETQCKPRTHTWCSGWMRCGTPGRETGLKMYFLDHFCWELIQKVGSVETSLEIVFDFNSLAETEICCITYK